MKVGLSSFNLRLSSPVVKASVVTVSAVLILIISSFILSGKDVALSIDGKTSHFVTRSNSVVELLAEKQIKVTSRDRIRPSLDSPLYSGIKVSIRRGVPVVVNINGKTRRIWTTALTVGRVVEALGVDTSADIKLKPASKVRVVSGMTIHLKLLNRWIEKVRTDVAYEVKREDDAGLNKGRTKVVAAGKPGVKETVIEHVMAGGQEIEKITHGAKIVQEPVTKVVKVGTRVPRQAVAGSPGPGISVSRGRRSLVVVATAYAANTGGAGARTATGTGVYKGIVAVDPRVIPLGTRLYIDGYGSAVAADTGGAIKGNRIDLGFSSAGEAFAWGRRTVAVRILD